jgi:hypothetical protein
VTWDHPIGGEVTGYNPYPLCTGSARWVHKGYVDSDSDNGIHPKHRHCRQLRESGIPSIESPVTSLLSPVTQSITIKIMGLVWNLVQKICAKHWEWKSGKHEHSSCRHVELLKAHSSILFRTMQEWKTCARRQAKQLLDRARLGGEGGMGGGDSVSRISPHCTARITTLTNWQMDGISLFWQS